MGGVCSCSDVVAKYEAHVLSLYPDPRSPDEMRTLGGVLQQDDVSKWRLRASPGDLMQYLRAFPARIAPTAAFVAKRIRGDLARGRLRAAAIGLLILQAMVQGAHEGDQLALYEASVLNSMHLAFQHSSTELQIVAAQLLCTLLQVQEPASLKAARAQAAGAGRGDVYALYAAGLSGADYRKYAGFYPYVLSMATRNPPPGRLAQMTQQAKDLFLDRSERDKQSGGGTGGGTGATSGGGMSGDPARKRIRDLAELEEQAQAREMLDAHHLHRYPSSKSLGHDDAAAPKEDGASSSSSSSSSLLKLHISLWRSRYFGLKALGHLVSLNREWGATLARLDEIVPALLSNLPKNKAQLRAVSRDLAGPNPAAVLQRIDEAWKSQSDDKDKEKEKEKQQQADEKEHRDAAAVAAPPASTGQRVVLPPLSFKEELASRTGITLHHVQLLAYHCFRSLCRLPGLTLQLPAMLGPLCTWMDQHQRTMPQTNLDGTVVQHQQQQQPAPAGATTASPIAGDREEAGELSASSLSSHAPFAWENLYFSAHLFVSLLCRHLPFEGGSIDQLVMALLQHVADIDETSPAVVAAGSVPAQGSRRGSKVAGGAGEDVLSSPTSTGELEAVAAGAPTVVTPVGKSSLAADFKQLFHKKKGKSVAARGRHPKHAQIAILQLLHAVLTQASSATPDAGGVLGQDDEDDGADAGSNRASPPPLCLMNYQIILDQLLSLLIGALRASAAAAQSSASGAGAVGVGSSGGSGGDAEALEAERALETAASLCASYLTLLSTVTPSLLVQRLASFNDALQSLTLVLQLVLARPGATTATGKATKRALMDTAYSMSLGLMSWGSLAAEADAAAAASSDASGAATAARRSSASSFGFPSPLSERTVEARGRGLPSRDGGARARNNNTSVAGSSSNLSSASLYESLLHAVLGCIACESEPAARSTGYRILQGVLMTLSGFGAGWASFPSAASAASLLLHSGAFGLGGFSLGLSGLGIGLNRGPLAMTALSHQSSSSSNADAAAGAAASGETKETTGDNAATAAAAAGLVLSAIEEKSADPDQSPSPTHVLSGGQHGLPSSLDSAAGLQDLRAQRIPQILASTLDIQSQIHRAGAGGGASGGAGAPSSRRSGAGGSAFFGGSSLPNGGATLGSVSLQDHKWILSLIYYEVTQCFSAPAADEGAAENKASADGLKVDPSLAKAPAAASAAANNEPSAFQLASSILRPRGRGLTTDDNVALCFQLLILLLLQRQPSSSSSSGEDCEESGAGVASDLASLQQILALQLPMQLSLLSFLRAASAPGGEASFDLSGPARQRLAHWLHASLWFVSKLALVRVDSQWMRQQSVALEDALRAVAAARQAKGESAEQVAAQAGVLFGLAPSHSLDAVASPSSTSSDASAAGSVLLDPEVLSSILARLLVEPPSSSAAGAAASGSDSGSAAQLESVEESIAEQRAYLLDPASFEPFALKFLLPERAPASSRRFNFRNALAHAAAAMGGIEYERESSASWAPSAMGVGPSGGGGGGGGADGSDEQLPTGRVGSFFGQNVGAAADAEEAAAAGGSGGSGVHGHTTPRQQYSPGLRGRMAPATGAAPGTMTLPSSTLAHSSSSASSNGVSGVAAPAAAPGGLASVPQSPIAAAPSASALLAEMDQQSFQAIAHSCTKMSTKSSDEFLQFMSGLESAAPLSNAGAAAPVAASRAAPLSSAASSDNESKEHKEQATAASSKEALAMAAFGVVEEDGGEWHPDATVLAPLAPSTLDLFFPQLASFDLYLTSEIE